MGAELILIPLGLDVVRVYDPINVLLLPCNEGSVLLAPLVVVVSPVSKLGRNLMNPLSQPVQLEMVRFLIRFNVLKPGQGSLISQ